MWTLWLHCRELLVLFKECRRHGEKDTLTTINKSAVHTTKSCFMRPGKTVAPISAQGSAVPLWNALFKIHWSLYKCLLPTCLDKCWLWIHPEGLNLSPFPWFTCASLYKLLVIKCFFKCDSVWLRRATAKLPPAPEEFPILLLTCFKIFYLLIFLLLFWGDFFSLSAWQCCSRPFPPQWKWRDIPALLLESRQLSCAWSRLEWETSVMPRNTSQEAAVGQHLVPLQGARG